MRVHHIINSYSLRAGGAERLARGLHLALLERGIDSHILGLESHADDEVFQARSLGLRSSKSWRAFWGIRKYIKKECKEGDIVHAHLFPSNLYCGLLGHLMKGPLFVTEHSTSNRRRGTMLGRLLDPLIYKACNRVACISEGTELNLHEWMPITKEKTKVIWNGVSLAFTEIPRREAKKRLLVVSTGNLREVKNYPAALHAMALLRGRTNIEFNYRIAGEGTDRQKLKRLINELGLSACVKLLGFVDDTQGLLRKADVFLMPSSCEGFGLAAVEAMNAGLPIVASDVAGLREVTGIDGQYAKLVNPNDPDDIASKLLSLLNDPEQRKILGERAFERSHKFSSERMVEEYIDFYSEHRLSHLPNGKGGYYVGRV